MVQICYILAILCEMIMGIVLSYKLYPEFRIKNRLIKVLAVLLLLIQGGMYAWNSLMFYVSTLFVIIISFQISLTYWIFWKSNFFEIFLLEIFYFTNIAILKMPLLTIHGLLEHRTFSQVNENQKIFADAIYIFVIVLIIGIIIYKYDIVGLIFKRTLLKNKTYFFCVITAEWFMFAYSIHIGEFGFSTMDLVLNMLSILCVVGVIVYTTLFWSYQQIRDENIYQQAIGKNLKKRYLGLQKMYEINRQQMHNIKHELLYICNCLEENNVFGAYESSKKYLKEFNSIEKKVWTGFTFLDFVLNYKKAEIEQKDIKFYLDIELQQLLIPEDDCVIILGNLLDNAIEAAEKCKNKKYINVKICNINRMLLIRIENSCSEIPVLKQGKFLSKKKNRTVHGIGLDSVKRIIAEHQGDIHFEYTEDYFQVEILI